MNYIQLILKSLTRENCWWSTIDYDIEQISKNCFKCNKIKNNPTVAPIHPWGRVNSPFQRIYEDYAGPFYRSYYFT